MYNKKQIILFLFLLFIITKNLFASNYYIDNKNGDDSNSGLVPSDAWKTIAKVNQSNFSQGDSIFFNSDGIWREELRINSSGSISFPIYIGKYGGKKKPKIYGSEKIRKWEKVNDNIWKTNFLENSTWIWFIDEKIHWGCKVSKKSDLNNDYEFFFDDEFIYIYLESLPSSFKSIETSIRNFGIVSGWYHKPHSNIIIEGIEICFTINSNIRAIGSNNWEIKNNLLHHSGAIDESDGQGIQWEGKYAKILNNKIFENGQHGIFISSFGNYDVTENLIEGNEVYNNYHTSIDLMNDGGDAGSHQNTIIRRNLIYDEESFDGKEIGIQTLGYGEGIVKYVTIHHNIIFELNGMGISVMGNSDSIYVHNNTVVETESACINVDNNEDYCEVKNNASINNKYYAVLFLHNIKNKNFSNNFWFTEKSSPTQNVFVENEYISDYSKYSNRMGGRLNSTFANPQISLKNKKVKLLKKSPSIDSGVFLNYKSDFYGKKIKDRIDVGAVEF